MRLIVTCQNAACVRLYTHPQKHRTAPLSTLHVPRAVAEMHEPIRALCFTTLEMDVMKFVHRMCRIEFACTEEYAERTRAFRLYRNAMNAMRESGCNNTEFLLFYCTHSWIDVLRALRRSPSDQYMELIRSDVMPNIPIKEETMDKTKFYVEREVSRVISMLRMCDSPSKDVAIQDLISFQELLNNH